MDVSQKALSDIVVYNKYAKYIPELKRRETWDEIISRYLNMMVKKYPQLKEDIEKNGEYLRDGKVLPSMRALQFAGPAIEKNHSRLYNCFSEDTEFITSVGVKSFEDFENGDEVTVLTPSGSWKKATVKSYGKQRLNHITLKKGRSVKTVKATENHRWLKVNGESTTNLTEGDVLLKAKDIFSEFDYDESTPIERLYWCYGFVYGDGTKVKDSKGEYKYSMLRLCGHDVQYEKRFLEMGFKSSSSASLSGDTIVYTGKYLKNPPNMEIDNPALTRAFVSGYLQADGEKVNNKTFSNRYTSIQSSEKDHINFIRSGFAVAGVHITNELNLTGEVTNFGVRPETYKFGLFHKIGQKHNTHWVVSAISCPDDYQTVWCLEVEDEKAFVLKGGITTGNCAYLPVEDYTAFSEIMFLLLGGSGVGYSVQKTHVEKLPEIQLPTRQRKFLIGDSIEGWADAVKALMKAYFGKNKSKPLFDYSDIRLKGARLVTAGGKAPGPEPLRICLTKIESILNSKVNGDKLTDLECHDIVCHIADAVLAGGIRRAALISLFSMDSKEMATCKHGNWWELNPQRGRANNSAVIVRNRASEKDFLNLWEMVKDSGSGEPGLYWTNDPNYGTNPCCEISLRPYTFCNLCEINAGTVTSQKDFEKRAEVAAFFGTLQAGFTDFHYLRDSWKTNTEKDALIGVGITGICNGTLEGIDLEMATIRVKDMNSYLSSLIGINKAARTTTVKPSGTTSCVVGTSSGIHEWHDKFYIRNMQCSVGDDLYTYFVNNHPGLIKVMDYDPRSAVIGIPQKAPDAAILRSDVTAMGFLDRVHQYNMQWVKPGHRRGPNTNNVSATCSIKDNEWGDVGEWMWENKDYYNGLSVLPYDGGTYKDAPFQTCTEEEYEAKFKLLSNIDLTKIIEEEDNTDLKGELACAGGSCDLTY